MDKSVKNPTDNSFMWLPSKCIQLFALLLVHLEEGGVHVRQNQQLAFCSCCD